MNREHCSEPLCYIVVDCVLINTKLFKLPGSFGQGILLVEYKEGDLHDPDVIPILEYYNAGTRKFLYKDAWWSECDIDWRDIIDKANKLYLEEKLSAEVVEKIWHKIQLWRSVRREMYLLGQQSPVYVSQRTYGNSVKAMYRVRK